MIEVWKVDKRKLPRTSQKSPELIAKKQKAVIEYLESGGEKKIVDIARENWLHKTQVHKLLKKELGNFGNEKNEISQVVLSNVEKGSRLAKEFIDSLKKEDLKNMDDLAKFTQALKSQYWLHNAIENYWSKTDTTNIIPVNIQVNIKNG